MASSSPPNKVMAEKTNHQDHHPLKCPRCDSSNTKFCYYNNYSLSQPRHFCKACKRYWTRGGTLRNVPVGGGCRRNKRHKRPQSSNSGGGGGDSISTAAAASTATANANPSVQPHEIDLSTHNPLFYNNPLELNFPFSSFRVSNSDNTGFDLHHPGVGLGFSLSGLMSGSEAPNDYKNGFKPIPFSSNNSILFGSSSSSTTAFLLGSSLHHQKYNMPYEDPRMPGGNGIMVKELKPGVENGSVWNPNPNPVEHINSSDPSSLLWNTTNLSAWFDPSNMGSSVPSLI